MLKICKRHIVVLMLAFTLAAGAAFAGGSRTALAAEEVRAYAFTEVMRDFLQTFYYCELDFFNFSTGDMAMDASSVSLLQLAKKYVPHTYADDYNSLIMEADDLAAFVEEAFGFDLPREDIGSQLLYIAEDGTFSLENMYDTGLILDTFVIRGLAANGDGSLTAKADLYFLDAYSYDDELGESLKNPISKWDQRAFYAKAASQYITFTVNDDPAFFPFRLISIESEMLDWSDAQGVYESADGKTSLAFRVNSENGEDFLQIKVTDADSGTTDNFTGYVTANAAWIVCDDEFTFCAFVGLDTDGEGLATELTVMDNPEREGYRIAGRYTKVSDDVIPQEFRFDFGVRELYGTAVENPAEGQVYLGRFCMVGLGGFNDDRFADVINGQINALIMQGIEEFDADYSSLQESIWTEEDAELAGSLIEVIGSYSYTSTLLHLTSSESYNAIAELRHVYTGGAHNNPFAQVFNIDSSKKRLLTLSDIFKSSGWRSVVEQILTDAAASDEYKELVYTDLESVRIVNESNFYLMDGQLMIFFQPYEIGPYSSYFISFAIPFDDIRHILRDEFLNADYTDNYGEGLFVGQMLE